jgi:aldose 1-epimerase
MPGALTIGTTLTVAAMWMSATAIAAGSIRSTPFGRTREGTDVQLFSLTNARGMEARITTYGGIVVTLTAPDRHGRFADVVLGYDSFADYRDKNGPYFGALIGRYANRIAHGRFSLNGSTYTLTVNNGSNSLHGGKVGFDKVVWTVSGAASTSEGPQLSLKYVSQDEEEGYPGKLEVSAVYTLTDENALRLDYTATTDKETVLNLTQHSYFNLRGYGDVLNHRIQINANRFTPVDDTLIPTGESKPVAGTPFDFLKPRPIGARIGEADEQLGFGKGYDHNWIVNRIAGASLATLATVFEPETGRVLEVLSTEPGLQFYSGNLLERSIIGKAHTVYGPHSGFCLEPQHFPDSPNQPQFPSTVLKPGQIYRNTIVYRFTAR